MTPMPTENDTGDSDIPDLQDVLTRYVDSTRGYLQAAELMERADFSAAFAEIAARRGELAVELSTLIRGEGERAEEGASIEGALHRWWIRLRDTLSDEELEAVLRECVRGEKVLLASIEKALDGQATTTGHAEMLRRARDEIATAIGQFKTILDD
jgi:uncharacterized protein (TIGR02284 family)